jgi:hypothetical protein
MGKNNVADVRASTHPPGPDDPIAHVVSAMTAGASGTILTNPLWVVKTRFMTQDAKDGDVRYRHTWDALIRIYREEGPRAFYRGMLPSLFGVAHVAVQFPLYERFKVLSRESGPLSPLPTGRIISLVLTFPRLFQDRPTVQTFRPLLYCFARLRPR